MPVNQYGISYQDNWWKNPDGSIVNYPWFMPGQGGATHDKAAALDSILEDINNLDQDERPYSLKYRNFGLTPEVARPSSDSGWDKALSIGTGGLIGGPSGKLLTDAVVGAGGAVQAGGASVANTLGNNSELVANILANASAQYVGGPVGVGALNFMKAAPTGGGSTASDNWGNAAATGVGAGVAAYAGQEAFNGLSGMMSGGAGMGNGLTAAGNAAAEAGMEAGQQATDWITGGIGGSVGANLSPAAKAASEAGMEAGNQANDWLGVTGMNAGIDLTDAGKAASEAGSEAGKNTTNSLLGGTTGGTSLSGKDVVNTAKALRPFVSGGGGNSPTSNIGGGVGFGDQTGGGLLSNSKMAVPSYLQNKQGLSMPTTPTKTWRDYLDELTKNQRGYYGSYLA